MDVVGGHHRQSALGRQGGQDVVGDVVPGMGVVDQLDHDVLGTEPVDERLEGHRGGPDRWRGRGGPPPCGTP